MTRFSSPTMPLSICNTRRARFPGIGQVRVFGAGPYSMRVWLDPNKLEAFGLTTKTCWPPSRVRTSRSSRAARCSAGARRSTLPVHHQRARPVVQVRPIQGHHRQVDQRSKRRRSSACGDIAQIELGQQCYSNLRKVTGHKSAQIVLFALPTSMPSTSPIASTSHS